MSGHKVAHVIAQAREVGQGCGNGSYKAVEDYLSDVTFSFGCDYRITKKSRRVEDILRVHDRLEAAKCGDIIMNAKALYKNKSPLYQLSKLQMLTSARKDNAEKLKFVVELLSVRMTSGSLDEDTKKK